jgi:hypothetical protein
MAHCAQPIGCAQCFCVKGHIMQRRTVFGLFATSLLVGCGVITPPALTGPALLFVYTNG